MSRGELLHCGPNPLPFPWYVLQVIPLQAKASTTQYKWDGKGSDHCVAVFALNGQPIWGGESVCRFIERYLHGPLSTLGSLGIYRIKRYWVSGLKIAEVGITSFGPEAFEIDFHFATVTQEDTFGAPP